MGRKLRVVRSVGTRFAASEMSPTASPALHRATELAGRVGQGALPSMRPVALSSCDSDFSWRVRADAVVVTEGEDSHNHGP